MTATSAYLNARTRSEAEFRAWKDKKAEADRIAGLIPVWEQRGVPEHEIWPWRVALHRLARELRGESNVVRLFDDGPVS